jgi:transposase
MAIELLPDGLWNLVEPFIPVHKAKPRGGGPRLAERTCVMGDRGSDAEAIRRGLRDRGIMPFLAKRNTEHGSGLGRWRWVVERTFAWLNQFRRLRVRYEKRADIHEAFLSLGCALVCWQSLERAGATFSN